MVLSLPQPGRIISGSSERKGSGMIIPFSPRHYEYTPPSGFKRSSGLRQERIMLDAIGSGNLGRLNVYRPDMEAGKPLDLDEGRMAVWCYNITHLGQEITPALINGSQIHRTVYSMQSDELAEILERERQRAEQFAPGLFSPKEPIGRFTAARRYLGVLVQRAQFEQETPEQRAKRIRRRKPVNVFQAAPANTSISSVRRVA